MSTKGRVCRSAFSIRLDLQALVISEFFIANYNRSRTVHAAAEWNNESDWNGSLISEDAEVTSQ